MSDLNALIVNYNSSNQARKCIESIKENNNIPIYITIINNSKPNSVLKQLERNYDNVRIIQSPCNLGFAAAINSGLEKTNGEFVLIANPDVQFKKDSLELMLNYMKSNKNFGVVGPKVLNPNGSRQNSARRFPKFSTLFLNSHSLLTRLWPTNKYSRKYLDATDGARETKQVDWISGCCLMFRRELLDYSVKFDENYFLFMEDVDFCRQVWQTGRYKVIYCPDAEVVHSIGISNNNNNRQIINHRHNSIRHYIEKHFKKMPYPTRAVGKAVISLREAGLIMKLNLQQLAGKYSWKKKKLETQ